MDSDSGKFQDWEVLLSNSDSESGFGDLNDLGEIDVHSDGIIQANYFSIEAGEDRLGKAVSESSETSDNPSWIEPRSEIHYPMKDSTEFWSDSGSAVTDERKFNDFEEENVVGLVGNEKGHVGFEGIEEISCGNGKSLDDLETLCSNSERMRLGDVKVENFDENGEQLLQGNTLSMVESTRVEEDSAGGVNTDGKVEVEIGKVEKAERKTVVWWKVPMEFLKYCVYRMNPMWTFSMAAAVMGFVILGRRLYNMKKTRSMQLKVTMDDKKVSQFMSHAARLNEAFSVVKRVPLIRPALPAVGVTPWPVMSLR